MFEVKVNYLRQTGEDNPGTVKETYLVDGVNPSDAEKCLIEEIKPYIYGDCEVPVVRKRNFYDIFPNLGCANWYEGKAELITVDGEVEKRCTVTFLVQANDIADALYALKNATGGYDCEIIAVKKSAIIDVLRATK
jgi:hypothetical protein